MPLLPAAPIAVPFVFGYHMFEVRGCGLPGLGIIRVCGSSREYVYGLVFLRNLYIMTFAPTPRWHHGWISRLFLRSLFLFPFPPFSFFAFPFPLSKALLRERASEWALACVWPPQESPCENRVETAPSVVCSTTTPPSSVGLGGGQAGICAGGTCQADRA